MERRVCPRCKTDMQLTHEPYEYRCSNCGFWFDAYAGKQITFSGEQPPVIEYENDKWVMKGQRLGQAVEISYQPKMEGVVVGYCVEKNHWLVEHITPKGGYSVFTEMYFDYVDSQKRADK